jgi:hypothetical protein
VREAVSVRYIEVADDITQIRATWPQLEDAVGSLRGRKFLAAFDPVQGWYRTCVALRENAEPSELALPEFVVPGGEFLRVRLRGDPPEVYDEIGATYARLEAAADRDDARPSIESYRRLDVIDVLMPVNSLP